MTAAMTPPVPLVLRSDEVSEVMEKLVEVALVEVEFVVVRLAIDDDAEMRTPTVDVGESMPLVIAQSLNDDER